jgi:molybdopterin biosynthesis enzyme
LALLAQVGVNLQHVKVKELIRVGVLSTGNELIVDRQEKSAVDGKIPDVNRPLLLAQLSTYQNCEAVDLGIVTDDEGLDAISTKLKGMFWEQGNGCVDVVITTGGISMGEKDIMEQVFIERMGGKIHFGR